MHAGMAWARAASASMRAAVPSCGGGTIHSSADQTYSVGSHTACCPSSCISFRIAAPSRRDLQTSFLPPLLYSSSPSWSHSSLVSSVEFRAVALSGRSVQDDIKRKFSSSTGLRLRSCMAENLTGAVEETILSRNAQNAVVVYSKSWCPYCSRAKGLFQHLGVEFSLVEIDQLVDGDDIRDALRRLTGSSTVPNIFIGGRHVGGCDDVMALNKKGELVPLLEAAGAKFSNP